MMNKKFYILLIIIGVFINVDFVRAGNPDRQGEAGASELLMNPWARSAGLHSIGTSFVTGLESMRINIAGLSRMKKEKFLIAMHDFLKVVEWG